MKKTKVIIPALGILLLSTAASVTGTVAWFSMNSEVQASGLTIKARSDSAFLVIEAGGVFHSSTETVSVSTSGTTEELIPVAPATTLTPSNIETPASWHYAYSDSPAKPGNAQSDNPDTPDDEGFTPTYTPCSTLNNYVESEQFAIGLNITSGVDTSAQNIKLRSVTIPQNTGLSVVVVYGTAAADIATYRATSNTPLDLGVKADKNGLIVTVYYFIDGENSYVYSNNAANLTGAVSFVFDVNP